MTISETQVARKPGFADQELINEVIVKGQMYEKGRKKARNLNKNHSFCDLVKFHKFCP